MDQIPPPRAGQEGSGGAGTEPSPPGAGPAPARTAGLRVQSLLVNTIPLSRFGHDLCCSAVCHLLFLKMHPDVSAPNTLKSATS